MSQNSVEILGQLSPATQSGLSFCLAGWLAGWLSVCLSGGMLLVVRKGSEWPPQFSPVYSSRSGNSNEGLWLRYRQEGEKSQANGLMKQWQLLSS